MKQSFLLSALVMCTTFCFWGCSNEEKEFVISSEKITGVEQMVTWKSHTNLTHPTRAFSGSIINRFTGSKIL